jgi:hypothetical protein
MPNVPEVSVKIQTGDFDRFAEFARRLFAVPHSHIQAQLDAEREAKRTSKASASHVPGVASTPRRASKAR